MGSKNERLSLNPNERSVNQALIASNVNFINLMKISPRLRAIQTPPSRQKTVSKAIKVFMEMQWRKLLEGDVWGHRKEIDEHFVIEDATIAEIESVHGIGRREHR